MTDAPATAADEVWPESSRTASPQSSTDRGRPAECRRFDAAGDLERAAQGPSRAAVPGQFADGDEAVHRCCEGV